MCHRKEAERRDILRRIRAAGCPIEVDLPPVDSRNELLISQAGEAYLFDLGTAGAALVLWMRFARAMPGHIWIVEFGDVIVPCGRLSASWLDPLPGSGRDYQLPNGFTFPRDSVLNDRLGESGLRLRSGRFLEGYVLGSTEAQIPAQYIHGSFLDGEFSVLDGVSREFRGEVRFVVDRRAKPIRRDRSVRLGQGLYSPSERPLQWDSALSEGNTVFDAGADMLAASPDTHLPTKKSDQ